MHSTGAPPQNKTHTHGMRVQELEKNSTQREKKKKQAGVAILISEKIDFKTKAITKVKTVTE